MTRDRTICERCGEWVDCVAGMPWLHTCRPELNSLGRVPPDEGQLHFVKDADGNVEDVSDEELEAAAQWFDERFGESSEVGRDPRYPHGWWFGASLGLLPFVGLAIWWFWG